MDFEEYILAGYPLLWMRTHEYDRCEQELSARIKHIPDVDVSYASMSWDSRQGVRNLGDEVKSPKSQDPIAVLQFAVNEMSRDCVLFLHNYHKWINNIDIIQTLLNSIAILKKRGKTLVILSPFGAETIPVELSKAISTLEFSLPTREQLVNKLQLVAHACSLDIPAGKDLETILEAATGLTAFEAENAFSLTTVHTGKFDETVITEQKAQVIKKNASLRFEHFRESFESLGGLENLKEFCLLTALDPRSRGILILGVSGVGKSHFAKALGFQLKRPTLSLDFGGLYDKHVGGTEEKTRDTLNTVDAMAPCILFLDEIEKGLSGSESSGKTDGGTSSRVFGSYLRWSNDHTSVVYPIATCNDISKLPTEFKRAERWDAIFFVDLPNETEKSRIFDIYLNQYNLDPSQPRPATTSWTGAEIKTLCRLASMMNTTLIDASRFVVPICVSDGEKIEALRTWAKDKCIPASKDLAQIEKNSEPGRKIRTKGAVA